MCTFTGGRASSAWRVCVHWSVSLYFWSAVFVRGGLCNHKKLKKLLHHNTDEPVPCCTEKIKLQMRIFLVSPHLFILFLFIFCQQVDILRSLQLCLHHISLSFFSQFQSHQFCECLNNKTSPQRLFFKNRHKSNVRTSWHFLWFLLMCCFKAWWDDHCHGNRRLKSAFECFRGCFIYITGRWRCRS